MRDGTADGSDCGPIADRVPGVLGVQLGCRIHQVRPAAVNAVVVAGTKAERRTAIGRAFRADEPTVLITSYDLLRRDVDDYTAR